jgi:hypothetical protein
MLDNQSSLALLLSAQGETIERVTEMRDVQGM